MTSTRPDILFVGDSITQRWTETGLSAWNRYYSDRNAANLGINQDRTENVLWRLDQGNLSNAHPKLVVLLIGTNDIGNSTNDQTANAIQAIVDKLRIELPLAKILLMGLLPRGTYANNWIREQTQDINARISRIRDGDMVTYLDVGNVLLNPDGTLNANLMDDKTHPSGKGYEAIAAAIEPTVNRLLNESQALSSLMWFEGTSKKRPQT